MLLATGGLEAPIHGNLIARFVADDPPVHRAAAAPRALLDKHPGRVAAKCDTEFIGDSRREAPGRSYGFPEVIAI